MVFSTTSQVPLTGPVRVLRREPPRLSLIEFNEAGGDATSGASAALPLTSALPVIRRAVRERGHETLWLAHGAVVLAMQLVSAGKVRNREDDYAEPVLGDHDRQRLAVLARSRGSAEGGSAESERFVADLVAAVVDHLGHQAEVTSWHKPAWQTRHESKVDRLRSRLSKYADQGLAGAASATTSGAVEVSLSLRVEAPEELLLGGQLQLVLQVHDAANNALVVEAAALWAEPSAETGFDPAARLNAISALRRAGEVFEPLRRLMWQPTPDRLTLETDELMMLLDEGVSELTRIGVSVLWPRKLAAALSSHQVLDEATRPDPADGGPLQTGLFTREAMFAFQWRASLDGAPLTDAEMDQLAAATLPIIKLRDNWVIVDAEVARRARKRIIRTLQPIEALAAVLPLAPEHHELAVHDHVEPAIVGASLLRLRDQLLDAAFERKHQPVEVPARLRATLRGYQREGLHWLATLTDLGLGGCLADDMGLGKTITLIALALHRWQQAEAAGQIPGPVLVVCPTSLLGNWEAEFARFAPGVAVRRLHGSTRTLRVLPGSVVLTTYGTVRHRAELLAAENWDLVVADEAQHIKNASSATAKAIRTIDSRARIALTGTPVENNLTELWAILDWTVPGLLGSRLAFRKAWAAHIESGTHPAKAEEFARLISPFLLRRRKTDEGIAPELPAKTETDHVLSLTQEQAVLYQGYVRECMQRIERADEEARRGLILKLLTGLKQICNHPAHFLRQAGAELPGRSHKVDLLDELVETVLAEDGRLLVFTQYKAMGHLLSHHFERRGLTHQFLHGSVSARDRDAMVTGFQAGDVPVFLLSTRAGGTGLNLTRADHVVHFDRWWNPAVEAQATDRAHRIGQQRPVQVHRFITQGTIEERVAELLAGKQQLADAVLAQSLSGRGESAITELNDRELAELVQLRGKHGPSR